MRDLEYNQFYISGYPIRRVRLGGEWWYSLTDVIAFLTKSKNPMMYIQLRGNRDNKFDEYLELYVKKILFQTTNGGRLLNCCNLYGLFYITKLLPDKYRWRIRIFRSWIE